MNKIIKDKIISEDNNILQCYKCGCGMTETNWNLLEKYDEFGSALNNGEYVKCPDCHILLYYDMNKV